MNFDKIEDITITKESFAASMENMIDVLSKFKATSKEINLANLLVEEIFIIWNEEAKNTECAVKMNVYKRLGEIKITLRLKGDSRNPQTMTFDTDEDEIRMARIGIFKSNKDRIL